MECKICFSVDVNYALSFYHILHKNTQHSYCKNWHNCDACFKRNVLVMLLNKQPLECLTCHIPFNTCELINLYTGGEKIFVCAVIANRYTEKYANKYNLKIQYCPMCRNCEIIQKYPSIGMLAKILHITNKSPLVSCMTRMRCSRCRTKWCTKCGYVHKKKIPCYYVKDGDINIIRKYIDTCLSMAYINKCPICSINYELIEGCNHITCDCGAYFCHICKYLNKKCDMRRCRYSNDISFKILYFGNIFKLNAQILIKNNPLYKNIILKELNDTIKDIWFFDITRGAIGCHKIFF